MLGHRTLNLEDYVAILKRRWWQIVIPVVVLPIVALVISSRITPTYTSQALILIEQQKVPDSYVKPVVAEDLDDRLASTKEQILSRSRLQPIIERYNLGDPKANMDDRLVSVRKDIGIKPIHSEIPGARGLPGFFITFDANDAHTAQLVCREITSLFLTENLQAREQSAEGTTDFLRTQLDQAKANLDAQDAKLAAFQRENMGALPEQQTTNFNVLGSLNAQLDAATQDLSRMEQNRSIIQAMLAQNSPTTNATEDSTHPAVTVAGPSQDERLQLQKLQAQEADLSSRYTADYPDVIEVKREIRDLKKQMADESSPSASHNNTKFAAPDSPAVQQLRAQLHGLDLGIKQKQQQQGAIQAQIRGYQGRLEESPIVAAKFKELDRGHTEAQDFYNSLQEKMNNSQMATDLEHRQEGEQFRVMDDANLPDGPTFPKPWLFLAGGIVLGLLIGLGTVALLEYRDQSLRSERDIWAFTKLPTLGIIALTDAAVAATPKSRSRFKWPRSSRSGPADQPLPNVGG